MRRFDMHDWVFVMIFPSHWLQALQEFRVKFSAPEGYRLTETARQHLESFSKQRQWTHRPMTKQQLEHLYHSEEVAANVMAYLKERGHCEYSDMHGCDLYDHPESQMVITHGVSKTKMCSQKTGQQRLVGQPASGGSSTDGEGDATNRSGASSHHAELGAILDQVGNGGKDEDSPAGHQDTPELESQS